MTSSAERFTRLATRFGESGLRRLGPEAGADLADLVVPLRVLPYFHVLPEESASLRAYAEEEGQRLDEAQVSWARLGSDRAFDLCVTAAGEVRAVLLGYDEPERFVSSTAEAFADGLLLLDVLLESVAAAQTPGEAAAAFRATEQALRDADPRAFADTEHWWPLVLEDIRTTASVECYATFEFAAPDGERHLVTRSGGIGVHPEQQVWSDLHAAGIQPAQVTRIHTELEACFLPGHYCSMWLAMMFPDAATTHNVSTGETAAERAAAIEKLRQATQRTGSDG
ncbi:nucleic acid/nucleotide deaminase domain-containing protein [Kitasatospora sp. NPDC058965]|uniref:nucleic acid/nucleotide deaminase domain-containing protein n=1 Tax=Kitasatospora sp. NPDC058965 TaxID=3346682 RepID=UPI0036965E68